ncbi:alkaline phosphatase family protein [Metallosphaera hakonensis]|uniref:alkaline phosphatase family protein n=1 Tax=Metallosphaera hakonensis TaxID=79601 RepID=UPI0006D0CBB4|nr:alkaline phosphatase family protein [Metallosphaera hakonensis]
MIVEPNLNRSLYTLSLEVRNSLQGKSPVGLTEIERDKVILVLVDGLGFSLAEKVGIKAERIHSVFPTITITVLTTLLTASPPGVHGIMGWRVLNREKGKIDNLLGNEEVNVRELIKVEPYIPNDAVVLAPSSRPSSTLFKSLLGRVVPYYSPWDALTQALEIAKNKRPSFMFVYLPYVDSVSHHFGPNSEHTLVTAREVTRMVEMFAQDISREYSVVMTSDHGHVQIDGNVILSKDILEHVDLPPFGDHRNLMFVSSVTPANIYPSMV